MQKPVVVRSNLSGVHFGYLMWRKGGTVCLTRARRIWSWEGAQTCSHIAVFGVSGGNIGPETDIVIRGCDEIISATNAAANNLVGQKVWK